MYRNPHIIEVDNPVKSRGYLVPGLRTYYFNNMRDARSAFTFMPKGARWINRRTGKIIAIKGQRNRSKHNATVS